MLKTNVCLPWAATGLNVRQAAHAKSMKHLEYLAAAGRALCASRQSEEKCIGSVEA